jgi:hypothetical protein
MPNEITNDGKFIWNAYDIMHAIILKGNNFYSSMDVFSDTISKVLLNALNQTDTLGNIFNSVFNTNYPALECLMVSFVEGRPMALYREYYLRGVNKNNCKIMMTNVFSNYGKSAA